MIVCDRPKPVCDRPKPGGTHSILPTAFGESNFTVCHGFCFQMITYCPCCCVLENIIIVLRKCWGSNPWPHTCSARVLPLCYSPFPPKDTCFIVVIVTWCWSEPGTSCVFGRCTTITLNQLCSETVCRFLSVYFTLLLFLPSPPPA